VFLQSKEESDKQFKDQLDHMQFLNNQQIQALQHSTEKQINTLLEINSKKISALYELTEKQISALQDVTEKQIEALQRNTNEQIMSFEKQISEVTTKLSENSILLAEILGRELEKSIDIYTSAIKQEEERYNDLSEWKLLRTPQDKEKQLNKSWNRIQNIKNGLKYLMTKYNQVRQYLGIGQRTLNN